MESINTIGRMKIQVLGCSGNTVREHRATAFLLNDSVMLDAGTITDVLDDGAIRRISHVIISHTHIDHIKGIFPLVDELVMRGLPGITLVSAREILAIISANLLNDLIWPDLTDIPSKRNAMLKSIPLELEKPRKIEGLRIRAVAVNHTVFAVGYTVLEEGKGFAYTGDTGPTNRFWEVVKNEKGIQFVIAEVSFPERLQDLAMKSGHMTLSMLTEQLDRHGLKGMPVYITHMKPIVMEEILQEIGAAVEYDLRVLHQGETITL